MKKSEYIDIILNSNLSYATRKDLEKMTKVELKDMYDMLDEVEYEYYMQIY